MKKEEEKAATASMAAQFEELAARDERNARRARTQATAARTADKQPVSGDAYYVIKAPHYRQGVMYAAGTVVVVSDEIPSRTWRRVQPVKGAVRLPPIPPRPSPDDVEGFTEESPETVPIAVGEERPNPGGISPSINSPATTAIVSRANSPEEVTNAMDPSKREDVTRKADHQVTASTLEKKKNKET